MFSRKVLLRALACALLAMVAFPEQENQLYDLKVRLLARTHFGRPSSVLVVEVAKEEFDLLRQRFGSEAPGGDRNRPEPDAAWREKFETLRNQFFWDDGVYTQLLGRILAEQPRRLLVSFFYGDSLVLLDDNPSLQRLARSDSVLWASQFDQDQKLQKPAAGLTGLENYGFANFVPETDGVVRRAQLVRRNHISLPFRALVDGPESVRGPLDLTEPFLIGYTGAPGYVPSCRVLQLFDDPARCGSLRDRYVILSPAGNLVAGASLDRTPLGYMSRGELLANVLLTAREGTAYRRVSPYVLFFFVFAHCLLMAQIVFRFYGRRQVFAPLALLLAEGALVLLLMRFFFLHVPFVPFLLATFVGYVGFLWLKFAQQESKRWQAEKKTQYLRELDELKSNFLSLMSHDLKTPIAKVQALTERLSREASALSEDQRGILTGIQKSNEELAHYILSILNFQRIESQEIQLNRKSVDVNVLIEEVVQRLQPLAQDRGVQIAMDLEPMFAAEMDEQLIRQVLSNLLDNAIKYNQAGTLVTLKSVDQGDMVEVSVADNGVGIEPEQMERVFKKFSRSEKGTSERVKGTGLGLYLAKYFIELHGGSIEVESEPGRGTCFRFRLPVA